MRIALIADAFPPLRSSGAVQLRDLSREFVSQGHQLTVILPSQKINQSWRISEIEGYQVLYLRAPKLKDINYFRRTLGEMLMPFLMRRSLLKSPLANEIWDGIIWYSPSIFHGPLVNSLKKVSKCRSYLILRDIFPEWALDTGLMRKSIPYYFFSAIAKYQYSVADVIGVQTQGNLMYFSHLPNKSIRRVEVLQNWLGKASNKKCSIQLKNTHLAGRKVFIYAGNMGVAQGMDILLDLTEQLKNRDDVGFLFVGRGIFTKKLKDEIKSRKLENILFFDEIHPDEIPELYAQCSIGLVSLDVRHRSHNIPGKFLTYLQSGLPVLANVNRGNDIVKIIRSKKVGKVSETNEIQDLLNIAEELLIEIDEDTEIATRSCQLFEQFYSAKRAVQQVISSLSVK